VWDGDGVNRNALLTVFRNFDNATVVKGFAGATRQIDSFLADRLHALDHRTQLGFRGKDVKTEMLEQLLERSAAVAVPPIC